MTEHVTVSSGECALARRFIIADQLIEVRSNEPALLAHADAFFSEDRGVTPPWSLLTALPRPVEASDDRRPDAVLELRVGAEMPTISWEGRRTVVAGPLKDLEESVHDRRYTLFGNAGVLARTVYRSLERSRTLNFHACVLTDQTKRVAYIIAGPPGAGKTEVMLEGLQTHKLALVSTEIGHVRIERGGISILSGSIHDNVRQECLARWGLTGQDMDERDSSKHSVSFAQFAVAERRLQPEAVFFIFARVEGTRTGATVHPIRDKDDVARRLFESASEMLIRPRLYWGVVPAIGERTEASLRRWSLVQALAESTQFAGAWTAFGGPGDTFQALLRKIRVT